jgi:selenocysteine lyase/cysteine desulfurase
MALVPAGDFPGARGYLNTASIGLPPALAVTALREAVDQWVAGDALAPSYDAYVARARTAFARLHSVAAEDVAIGPQVSYFVGIVAASLPRRAEVVAYEGDFASLLYPFLARDDLKVRLVPLERVADAVTMHTSLVAVSAVQSSDGRVADLEALTRAAHEHGALTLLDATQASGWLPIDASRFDFVVAGAYKWMLAPRGATFMAMRPGWIPTLPPTAPGWYAADYPWGAVYGPALRLAADARRLDMSPAWLPWVGTAAALEYLEDLGIEPIHEHDVALANRLREGLDMPPSSSAVVPVPGEDTAEALVEAGIHVSTMRAGAVRVCFHLYNTEEDVDTALRALQ